MSDKPHLAYIGFIGPNSGLGRVADNLLSRLAEHWRITVVSLGRPEDYTCPYAERVVNGFFMHDRLGKLVSRKICEQDPPDIVMPYFDAAPVIEFVSSIPPEIPIVAHVPVDAQNIKDADKMNRLAHAVFLTEFGLTEARIGGYTGPASVIGHGVDLDLYQPKDKAEARDLLGLPQDACIFGGVSRNQLRKRFDLTLYSFKLFLDQTRATDAYLYCHAMASNEGWDLPQLAQYWGISDRVLFPATPLAVDGVPESLMPYVYSALDVQVSTSQGEGWGLTHTEGMACGVPQIVPDFAALAEWPGDSVAKVPVRYPCVTGANTNLVEWCIDPREMAEVMRMAYHVPWFREHYAAAGLALVQHPQFRWETLAAQFQGILEGVLSHATLAG